MRILVFLLFLLGPALSAVKPAWDPIPPETWAIHETPGTDDRGAVFIKTHRIFNNTGFEYHCRLRIYSERGKAATHWPNFPRNTTELRGRTVYPDGTERVFESEKDFHSVKRVMNRYGSYEQKVLVPPGLTGDCVVDLKWRSQNWLPLNSFGGYGDWDLSEVFAVRTMVLEVSYRTWFIWAYHAGSVQNLAATQESKGPESLIYTLKDLPPREDIPFSLRTTRRTPRFIAYLSLIRANTNASDKDATPRFWDAYRDRLKYFMVMRNNRGDAYEAFSKTLRDGLPKPPRSLAFELALRLRTRIRNLDNLTLREEAERTRKAATRKVEPRDLEESVTRGETTGIGMMYLYLELLRDAGLKPKMALVSDRTMVSFDLEDKNPAIFEKVLLGIEEPGHPPMWVEPSRTFGTPGLIRPQNQGITALVLDPSTWSYSTTQLAVHGPAASRREETYRLEILEEEDRFSLETRFLGNQEIPERQSYYQLEPQEQNRKFRESLESRFKNLKVNLAEVADATNPMAGIRSRVQGSLERESLNTRRVFPFPLTTYPLSIPDDLPTTREEPIVLPEASVLNSRCTFRVPQGYAWVKAPPFERSNAFGKVAFTAGPKAGTPDTEIEVALKVEVALPMAPASQWAALVEYLGWIREAFDQPLFLERTNIQP